MASDDIISSAPPLLITRPGHCSSWSPATWWRRWCQGCVRMSFDWSSGAGGDTGQKYRPWAESVHWPGAALTGRLTLVNIVDTITGSDQCLFVNKTHYLITIINILCHGKPFWPFVSNKNLCRMLIFHNWIAVGFASLKLVVKLNFHDASEQIFGLTF